MTSQIEIANYFRNRADWRRRVGEDYPDDPRNERSAHALELLADQVESLDDSHPLIAVGNVMTTYGDLFMIPGDGNANRSAERFGFDADNETSDVFLHPFASEWAKDEVESLRDATDDDDTATEMALRLENAGITWS
jgi:hypothetical protein